MKRYQFVWWMPWKLVTTAMKLLFAPWFFKFKRFKESEQWFFLYEWTFHVGPLEIRRFQKGIQPMPKVKTNYGDTAKSTIEMLTKKVP